MSLPRYFSDCPPFPADVPVIDLVTVSLRGLEAEDEEEANKVFTACQRFGFFLLDLRDSAIGQELLDDAEHMYDLTGATHSLPQEELDKYPYNPKVSLVGYKRAGILKTDDGGLDTTDLYTVGQDDILGNVTQLSNPAPIERNRTQCRDFILHAHRAASLVLAALEAQLQLPKDTFSALTALSHQSQSSLRLLLTKPAPAPTEPVPAPPFSASGNGYGNNHPRITLGQHTDIGLVTLLFNGAGGLQMLRPGAKNAEDNWHYIRPQPGCALINLGDTLVEWTGGILRSGLHRVVAAPGKQASVARRSFGYFLRPASEATMKRLVNSGSEGFSTVPKDAVTRNESGGSNENTPVDIWAAERAQQIVRGELKPHSLGGIIDGV